MNTTIGSKSREVAPGIVQQVHEAGCQSLEFISLDLAMSLLSEDCLSTFPSTVPHPASLSVRNSQATEATAYCSGIAATESTSRFTAQGSSSHE
jgi:hypothetical protein